MTLSVSEHYSVIRGVDKSKNVG